MIISKKDWLLDVTSTSILEHWKIERSWKLWRWYSRERTLQSGTIPGSGNWSMYHHSKKCNNDWFLSSKPAPTATCISRLRCLRPIWARARWLVLGRLSLRRGGYFHSAACSLACRYYKISGLFPKKGVLLYCKLKVPIVKIEIRGKSFLWACYILASQKRRENGNVSKIGESL